MNLGKLVKYSHMYKHSHDVINVKSVRPIVSLKRVYLHSPFYFLNDKR